jgi:hypothetical protein
MSQIWLLQKAESMPQSIKIVRIKCYQYHRRLDLKLRLFMPIQDQLTPIQGILTRFRLNRLSKPNSRIPFHASLTSPTKSKFIASVKPIQASMCRARTKTSSISLWVVRNAALKCTPLVRRKTNFYKSLTWTEFSSSCVICASLKRWIPYSYQSPLFFAHFWCLNSPLLRSRPTPDGLTRAESSSWRNTGMPKSTKVPTLGQVAL